MAKLPTSSIPQADSPSLLLRLLNLRVTGAENIATLLKIHERQVAYYERAAEILGLLDEEGHTTKRGEFLLLREPDDQLPGMAVVFCASDLGKAILRAHRARCVHDVDVEKIPAWLAGASELSGKTVVRRAKTLIRWLSEFKQAVPHASCEREREAPPVSAKKRRLQRARVHDSRPMSLRQQTLVAAALASARDELLRDLVELAPAVVIAQARARTDTHTAAMMAAEDDLEQVTSVRAATHDAHRQRILARKALHAGARMGLVGKELRELAEQLALDETTAFSTEQDLAARLAAANQGLVAKQRQRFATNHLSEEDLMQDGTIGLLRAIDKFDVRRGTMFSTYATMWIRQAMGRAIADREKMVRIPVHMQTLLRKLRNARDKFAAEHKRAATAVELAKLIDEPLPAVTKALKRLEDASSEPMLILDAEDDERGPAPRERASGDGASPLDNALSSEQHDAIHAFIEANIKKERDRTIIKMRFGIDHPREHTLDEIGKIFDVTRERIRQIEAKMLRLMRRRGLATGLGEFVGQAAPQILDAAPDDENEAAEDAATDDGDGAGEAARR